MTTFRTKFWELLSEKEQRESKRYGNVSDMADAIGITRTTFYKYADDKLSSVDAKVILSFLDFLDLEVDDLDRFLVIDLSPQQDAQESQSSVNGRINSSARALA